MDPQLTLKLVSANLARVREGILQVAQGRAVQLVCVTKYAQGEWVEALLDAGATDLAENLLPHSAERFAALYAAGRRFTRHLIGAQQSRKLKLIPGNFDWLQAVDSLKSAQLLERELAARSLTINALLQVNIGREPQKHGVAPEEAREVCAQLAAECPHLQLRGLMAVPPWPDAYPSMGEFERGTRDCFRQMREMFDTMPAGCSALSAWDTLSLGMSLDFVWAVEEGATMVRVGGALFEGLEG
jgi:PLP dependent protein